MKTNLRRIMLTGSWGSIAIALMGLLGYLPGLKLLASGGTGYIPMAPSTALGFLILGGLLLLPETRRRRLRPWCITAAWLVALFGLLEVAGHFAGMDLNFEERLVPAAGMLGDIPVARMSPVTGFLFFLSGWALALHLGRRREKAADARDDVWLGMLNLAVLLISFVFLLAYLYGSPLMYGQGATIPMALTTALAFLLLAAALCTAAPDIGPVCLLCEISTRGYLLRHILPLAVAAALFGSMALYLSSLTGAPNPAFLSAVVTILSGLLAAAVASRIAGKLGNRIDRTEAELKLANDTLRRNGRKYRELVENISDWIWEIDARGVYTYVSPRCRELLGYDPEELIGTSHLELMPPDEQARMGEAFADIAARKTAVSGLISRNLHKNGTEVILESSAEPLLDRNGELLGYRGIDRDVTDRIRTEEILTEERNRTRLYLETAQVMLMALDRDGRITMINPKGCEILGYPEAELLGRNWFECCIIPSQRPGIKEVFHRCIHEGEQPVTEYENEVLRKDGTYRLVRWHNAVLRNEAGELIGTLSSGEDVTQLRRADAMLRRFRELVDHALDAIFLIDRNGTIIDVNAAACNSLGYDRQSLIGLRIPDVISPDEKPLFEKRVAAILETGRATFESRHRRRDDTTFPVEVSVAVGTECEITNALPENACGGETMIAVVRDITERKRMEEELQQKEEMMLAQSRQAAMGDMIAMIAHQWRQPITVIAMAVNNIKLRLELDEPMSRPELLKIADTVTRQTKYLSKTIDDFRDFFKPDKEKEPTTLGAVVEATLTIIGKSLENNNIALIFTDNSTATLRTYPNELLQVFLNIMSNAKDALKDKKDARITLTVDETDDTLSVSFCDNGGGIPGAVIHRIGEPYFTTKEKTGTGLGIYMSKTVVERHLGGTLTWHNTGNGACFILSHPKE